MKKSTLLLTVLVVAATATAPAASEPQAAAGTLDLKVTFGMSSRLVPCPPEAPPYSLECRARTGTGSVPGLGGVTEIYG